MEPDEPEPAADVAQPVYTCHCGKRFLRNEHLRRHQANHRKPEFICSICQRSFTRSDLLRRHALRHNKEADSAPEARTALACHVCRASKTKCNGEHPCALCLRRGTPCRYPDPPSKGTSLPAPAPAPPPPLPVPEASGPHARREQSPAILSDSIAQDPNNDGLERIPPEQTPQLVVQDTQPTCPSTRAMRSLLAVLDSSQDSLLDLFNEADDDVQSWLKESLDVYLETFHVYWPVVHSPTFDVEGERVHLAASVLSIACWLTGPQDARELAIKIHERLVDILFKDMYQRGANSLQDRPWEFEPVQAVLLNVIFAFYTKNECLIATAAMLLSLSITVLRQLGLFNSVTADYQQRTHFPGTFIPFLLHHKETRVRLVTCFFKIDTYYSLLAGQCPHLQVEELDIDLPVSFASWNAYGLDEFHIRSQREHPARSGIRLVDFVKCPEILLPSAWLVEDVTMGLCGTLWAIWHHNALRRKSAPIATEPLVAVQEQLQKRLAYLREHLDRLTASSARPSADLSDARNEVSFFDPYLGPEKQLSSATVPRFKSLSHEATMLHTNISMYLHVDASLLGHLDKTSVPRTALMAASHASIPSWSLSPNGYMTSWLCFAALEGQERFCAQHGKPGGEAAVSAEPLGIMVLSKAQIILSIWLSTLGGVCGCGVTLAGVDVVPEKVCVCNIRAWLKRIVDVQTGLVTVEGQDRLSQ